MFRSHEHRNPTEDREGEADEGVGLFGALGLAGLGLGSLFLVFLFVISDAVLLPGSKARWAEAFW